MVLSLLLQTKAELRARVGRPQTSQSLPVIYCWPSQGGSFGFFNDFRCGVPLFIVILVIHKYKNR